MARGGGLYFTTVLNSITEFKGPGEKEISSFHTEIHAYEMKLRHRHDKFAPYNSCGAEKSSIPGAKLAGKTLQGQHSLALALDHLQEDTNFRLYSFTYDLGIQVCLTRF